MTFIRKNKNQIESIMKFGYHSNMDLAHIKEKVFKTKENLIMP